MEPWSITLSATLDRDVPREQTFALGRHIAGEHLLSIGVNDRALMLVMTSETLDPVDALVEARRALVEQLAAAGYTVTAWDSAEALSYAEVERRLEAVSLPKMVSAQEFAQLCGVSVKWIYKLEQERKRSAEAGEAHPFPTPVVPGYWIKAMAERFAENRKRKPGPAPRRES